MSSKSDVREKENVSDSDTNKEPKQDPNNLIWVDLEMTDLDTSKGYICEIAVLITDSDLNIIAEGPNVVIHQSEKTIAQMPEWQTKHFTESGLTESMRESEISLQDAEKMALEFVSKYVPSGAAPLCGNSITMDRIFLRKYMPNFESYLHYRIIDVSTVKELVKRWHPETFAKCPPKKKCHRAMSDIIESIDELQWYRANVFKFGKM